jgi:hypothetical protein
VIAGCSGTAPRHANATEGTNRMINDAGRIAFGFSNLDHQRRRGLEEAEDQ